MSLVIRSKYDEELEEVDQKKVKQRFKRNQSPRSPRTPKRKYKSIKNFVDRSKNFWASYNNFILCNRSIELRITKLFSFQNTQYIVAFSENLFEDTYNISHESGYKTQFMMYNIEACIFEICIVEHAIDLKMIMEHNVKTNIVQGSKLSYDVIENIFQTMQYATTSTTGEFCGRAENETAKNVWMKVSSLRDPILQKDDCGVCLNSSGVVSNRQKNIAMKISGLVISLWVVYVSLRHYSYLFQ